jgi:multidrug resistance protein MdtO
VHSSATCEGKQTLWEWLPAFLSHELAPYPGRWSVVSRMVIGVVLTMIVIITFRIPYGAIGVNCAFILSRENLTSTAKSGFYFILAFAAWAVLAPIGARMFASEPLTHFLWEAITVFLCFFLLKTLAYFPLAAGVVVVATGTSVIWYLPGPAELNIELTLWQILATAIGALITLLVEVVFRYFAPGDPLTDGIADRLRSVEALLDSYGNGVPIVAETARSITQYAMTGTSMLRQEVARRHVGALERSKMATVIALVGRSIDVSAALLAGYQQSEQISRERAHALKARVSDLRQNIRSGGSSERTGWVQSANQAAPLLLELEATVHLMESALETKGSAGSDSTFYRASGATNPLFVSDAFSNPEYLRFALAGTAAAMVCYVIYVGLNWPGISTAVTTCTLTALSDIGSSRQKQVLRIGGAAVGGFVFGVGSQIFVLPYIDSIVGLIILFACVTAISAYVATSSPRLSYAGLQMAFAFYLINVTDFSISLDLTIGRDRAIGVLLGIGAMWLVFERLYPRPAAVEMVRMFAASARLVAGLGFLDTSEGGMARIRTLRDQVNSVFGNVNAEADAVLFETGERRSAFLAARDRVRRWLSTLRTLYLLQLPLLPVGPSGEEGQRLALTRPRDARLLACVSDPLTRIAAHLESEIGGDSHSYPDEAGARGGQMGGKAIPRPSEDGNLTPSDRLVMNLAFELERDVLKEPVFKPQEPCVKAA